MKFSYNWLCELVDGVNADARELGRLITMKTAECDGVEEFAPWLSAVRAAKVLSVEPIGDTHNRKAQVDVSGLGLKTVVCGAPNCRPGIVTAYVPAGTKLGDKEIRKAVITGVESDGMLASGKELGINDDHSGIVELPGNSFELRPDWLIEIDNKSLTHRPDLWGHYGMAREVAALVQRPLKDPVQMDLLPSLGHSPITVTIDDFDLCSRYSALVFENVTVQPSPLWVQQRLEAIGLNPINNIVDVTNLVLAELPQPMHAFDLDKLQGGIVVRPARAGESIKSLNKETYSLDPSNLLITDAAGPIAIAGVIGGDDSAISGSTTRIVLESANFKASSVRKTSSKLKLRTDASMRFEKALDPLNCARGLARAYELLLEVSPGIRVIGTVEAFREPKTPAPIELPLHWLNRKLGKELPAAEVRGILEALEFGVAEHTPGIFTVTVPSWRATKDISMKDDLVEEVGRMVGYGSITPVPPLVPSVVPPSNPERDYHHAVRDRVSALGYTEVYNYSFLSIEAAERLGLDPAAHIAVENPIASDQNLMRTSLLPGIVKNLADNARHFESFQFFEIGREIHPRETGLPEEVPHIAAAIYSKDDGLAALLKLKQLAESLLPSPTVRQAPARSMEHPARAAEVLEGGTVVGRLFELHPRFLDSGRGAILDLDLALVERLQPTIERYRPLRRYPASGFDLSLVAQPRQHVGDIEAVLREAAGEHLVSIAYLRQFPLADGTSSVSFRLSIGAADHTLSATEITGIREQIITRAALAGFPLRG